MEKIHPQEPGYLFKFVSQFNFWVVQYAHFFSLQKQIANLICKLEIGHIGMGNVHPKESMSFALKLGQTWQE